MPLSKSLNSYYDIERALSMARAAGGGVAECKTHNAAIHWRQRAYHFRSLLSRVDKEQHPHLLGYVPRTSWDDMVLTIDGSNVQILFGDLGIRMVGLDGVELVAPPETAYESQEPPPIPDDDPLLRMALELAEKGPIPR